MASLQAPFVFSTSSGCKAFNQHQPLTSSYVWPVKFLQDGISSTTSPSAFVTHPNSPETSTKDWYRSKLAHANSDVFLASVISLEIINAVSTMPAKENSGTITY